MVNVISIALQGKEIIGPMARQPIRRRALWREKRGMVGSQSTGLSLKQAYYGRGSHEHPLLPGGYGAPNPNGSAAGAFHGRHASPRPVCPC